jgi:hypothetical protein
MKKSKNPNCHCDGSGYWKNPFDQEFKCACNKKKKSKAKGLTEKKRKRLVEFNILITDMRSPYYFSYKIKASSDFSIDSLANYLAKAARGGKKMKDLL